MRKHIAAFAMLCGAIALGVLPVQAQQFAGSQACNPSFKAPKPLPSIPCLTLKDWTQCNNVAQYVNNYNQWVQLVNEVQDLQCKASAYWNYPTSAASHIKNDLNEAADILSRANALTVQDKNLDQTIANMWPDFNPGYSTTQMDDRLDAMTNNSLLGVLKAAGALAAHNGRDADLVEQIKNASASAKNPTQATQMTVQLLAVMYEQMVKQQQFTALKLSQDAQHDLTEASRERSRSFESRRNADAQARMLYPVPPTLSQQQLQQLQQSWNH